MSLAVFASPAVSTPPPVLPEARGVLLVNNGILPLTSTDVVVLGAGPTGGNRPLDGSASHMATRPGDVDMLVSLLRPALGDVRGITLGPAVPAQLATKTLVPEDVLTAPVASTSSGVLREDYADVDLTERLARTVVPGVVQTSGARSGEHVAATRWTTTLTAPAAGTYVLELAAQASRSKARAAGTVSLLVDGEQVTGEPDADEAAAAVDLLQATLDLKEGQRVELVVEQVRGTDPLPGLALTWEPPAEVADARLAAVVRSVADAGVAVILAPTVPGPDSLLPGALPVDLAALLAALDEAEVARVVVTDAQGALGLAEWSPLASALLHVPAGAVEPESSESRKDERSPAADAKLRASLIAALLLGRSAPSGVLDGPLPAPTPVPDEADPPEPTFASGHGLVYVGHDIESFEVVRAPSGEAAGAAVAHLTVTATGTVKSETSLTVTIDARAAGTAGGDDVEVGAAHVRTTPGETLTLDIPLDLGAGEASDGTGSAAEALVLEARTDDPVPATATATLEAPTTEPRAPSPSAPSPSAPSSPEPSPGAPPDVAPSPAPPEVPAPDPSEPSREPSPEPSPDAPPRPPRLHPDPAPPTPPAPADPGALVLSVDDARARIVDAEALADRIRLTGTLPRVTVVDTRATARGWTLSAQATDLEGASSKLSATTLGWTPRLGEPNPAARPGPAVEAALSGGPGLARSTVLGQSAGLRSTAPVDLEAALVLETTLDTQPGTYTGTLTLTLFPVE